MVSGRAARAPPSTGRTTHVIHRNSSLAKKKHRPGNVPEPAPGDEYVPQYLLSPSRGRFLEHAKGKVCLVGESILARKHSLVAGIFRVHGRSE